MARGKTAGRVSEAEPWSPETDAGRRAIREQLERLLADARFRNSKRCPALLRFLVENALDGRADLRERTLGTDVFGRPSDYDTSLDPIVRATAGDIRKRIAQYYHEAGHEQEIRIDLPAGSYMPEFRLPVAGEPPSESGQPSQRRRWKPSVVVAASAVLLVAAAILLRSWLMPSALDRFWRPVLDSAGNVLVCVGPADKLRVEALRESRPADAPPSLQELLSIHDLALQDASTLARVAIVITSRGKNYRIQSDDATTLSDLRTMPTVLIGAFNNAWTLRATRQLRFTFDMSKESARYRIEDHQNPKHLAWETDMGLPYNKLTEDYAIVARFFNPSTERMTVVAAGIGQYGTVAAGEFLTNERYMEELAARAPAGWEHKNFEAVITTKVIDMSTGPPRITATWFW